jgi:3-hydroxyisobutyrate dehydrogenase-like beta-hydroxyacid dehydrogenase
MSRPAASIGFIGVGAIGRPMAECLLKRFPLVICDNDPVARAAFEGRAPVVDSAADLAARAEVIFACLPSLDSYRTAVLGPQGLNAAGGCLRHLVHVGTTGPELVAQMEAALALNGISIFDAPVSGGPARAVTGELMVMASGSGADHALLEPMIACYASSIVYLGVRPGLAQTMKLINNVLSAANLAVACEAMVLGVKAGLSPRQMLEVLNGGTGQNSATLTKIPMHVLPGTFDYGGRLEVVLKDLAMYVSEAHKLGVPASLSGVIAETYRKTIGTEGADADMTAVILPMERAAAVQVRAGRRGD